MAVRSTSSVSRPIHLRVVVMIIAAALLLGAAAPSSALAPKGVNLAVTCTMNSISTVAWEGRHVGGFTLSWYDWFGDVTIQTSANAGPGSSGSLTLTTPFNSTTFTVNAWTERGRYLAAVSVSCTQ